MADDAADLTRDFLNRVNRKLDWLMEETRDMKMRLSLIEQRLTILDTRLDRFEVRAERLEQRVDHYDHGEPRLERAERADSRLERSAERAERFERMPAASVEPLGQALGQALARAPAPGPATAAEVDEKWFEAGYPSADDKRRRYSEAASEAAHRVSYARFDRG